MVMASDVTWNFHGWVLWLEAANVAYRMSCRSSLVSPIVATRSNKPSSSKCCVDDTDHRSGVKVDAVVMMASHGVSLLVPMVFAG